MNPESQTNEEHTSVMIALAVPNPERYAINPVDVPDGTDVTPAQEMHLTLLFLGESSDIPSQDIIAVREAVQALSTDGDATQTAPSGLFPATVGMFPPSDQTDQDGNPTSPLWLQPQPVDQFVTLREALIEQFRIRGIDGLISTTHPNFTPHVTLAYVPADFVPSSISTVSPLPVEFNRLVLAVAGSWEEFSLQSASDPASEPPPLTASVEKALARTAFATTKSVDELRAVYMRQRPTPSPAASRVDQALQATREYAGIPRAPLTASAPVTQSAPRISELVNRATIEPDPVQRALIYSRALALAVQIKSHDSRFGSALTASLRSLVADGNSSAARSWRAHRQLRDRKGRWIEMGGGVRFKVRTPGAGSKWYHGVVKGIDIPNGKVSVLMDDQAGEHSGKLYSVSNSQLDQPKAIIGWKPQSEGKKAPAAPLNRPWSPERPILTGFSSGDAGAAAAGASRTNEQKDIDALAAAKRINDVVKYPGKTPIGSVLLGVDKQLKASPAWLDGDKSGMTNFLGKQVAKADLVEVADAVKRAGSPTAARMKLASYNAGQIKARQAELDSPSSGDTSNPTTWQGLKDALAGKTVVSFDTETTGLDVEKDDQVVQLAATKVRPDGTTDTFNTLVNPGRPISPESAAVHGLSDDDVKDAPSPREALQQFQDWVKKDSTPGDEPVLLAHNANFDMSALNAMSGNPGEGHPDNIAVLDTFRLARAVLPKKSAGGPVDGHGLGVLAEHFGIELGDAAHTADADSRAAGELLPHLLDYAIEHDRPTAALSDLDARQAEFEAAWPQYIKELDGYRAAAGSADAAAATDPNAPDPDADAISSLETIHAEVSAKHPEATVSGGNIINLVNDQNLKDAESANPDASEYTFTASRNPIKDAPITLQKSDIDAVRASVSRITQDNLPDGFDDLSEAQQNAATKGAAGKAYSQMAGKFNERNDDPELKDAPLVKLGKDNAIDAPVNDIPGEVSATADDTEMADAAMDALAEMKKRVPSKSTNAKTRDRLAASLSTAVSRFKAGEDSRDAFLGNLDQIKHFADSLEDTPGDEELASFSAFAEDLDDIHIGAGGTNDIADSGVEVTDLPGDATPEAEGNAVEEVASDFFGLDTFDGETLDASTVEGMSPQDLSDLADELHAEATKPGVFDGLPENDREQTLQQYADFKEAANNLAAPETPEAPEVQPTEADDDEPIAEDFTGTSVKIDDLARDPAGDELVPATGPVSAKVLEIGRQLQTEELTPSAAGSQLDNLADDLAALPSNEDYADILEETILGENLDAVVDEVRDLSAKVKDGQLGGALEIDDTGIEDIEIPGEPEDYQTVYSDDPNIQAAWEARDTLIGEIYETSDGYMDDEDSPVYSSFAVLSETVDAWETLPEDQETLDGYADQVEKRMAALIENLDNDETLGDMEGQIGSLNDAGGDFVNAIREAALAADEQDVPDAEPETLETPETPAAQAFIDVYNDLSDLATGPLAGPLGAIGNAVTNIGSDLENGNLSGSEAGKLLDGLVNEIDGLYADEEYSPSLVDTDAGDDLDAVRDDVLALAAKAKAGELGGSQNVQTEPGLDDAGFSPIDEALANVETDLLFLESAPPKSPSTKKALKDWNNLTEDAAGSDPDDLQAALDKLTVALAKDAPNKNKKLLTYEDMESELESFGESGQALVDAVRAAPEAEEVTDAPEVPEVPEVPEAEGVWDDQAYEDLRDEASKYASIFIDDPDMGENDTELMRAIESAYIGEMTSEELAGIFLELSDDIEPPAEPMNDFPDEIASHKALVEAADWLRGKAGELAPDMEIAPAAPGDEGEEDTSFEGIFGAPFPEPGQFTGASVVDLLEGLGAPDGENLDERMAEAIKMHDEGELTGPELAGIVARTSADLVEGYEEAPIISRLNEYLEGYANQLLDEADAAPAPAEEALPDTPQINQSAVAANLGDALDSAVSDFTTDDGDTTELSDAASTMRDSFENIEASLQSEDIDGTEAANLINEAFDIFQDAVNGDGSELSVPEYLTNAVYAYSQAHRGTTEELEEFDESVLGNLGGGAPEQSSWLTEVLNLRAAELAESANPLVKAAGDYLQEPDLVEGVNTPDEKAEALGEFFTWVGGSDQIDQNVKAELLEAAASLNDVAEGPTGDDVGAAWDKFFDELSVALLADPATAGILDGIITSDQANEKFLEWMATGGNFPGVDLEVVKGRFLEWADENGYTDSDSDSDADIDPDLDQPEEPLTPPTEFADPVIINGTTVDAEVMRGFDLSPEALEALKDSKMDDEDVSPVGTEYHALYAYAGEFSDQVNSALRNDLDEETLYTRSDIDGVMTVGDRIDAIDQMMSASVANEHLLSWRTIQGSSDSDWMQPYINAEVGDVLVDKGFMSTTRVEPDDLNDRTDPPPAYGGKQQTRVIIEIGTPPGTHAIDINGVFENLSSLPGAPFPAEEELLLDRSLPMEITERETSESGRSIVLRVSPVETGSEKTQNAEQAPEAEEADALAFSAPGLTLPVGKVLINPDILGPLDLGDEAIDAIANEAKYSEEIDALKAENNALFGYAADYSAGINTALRENDVDGLWDIPVAGLVEDLDKMMAASVVSETVTAWRAVSGPIDNEWMPAYLDADVDDVLVDKGFLSTTLDRQAMTLNPDSLADPPNTWDGRKQASVIFEISVPAGTNALDVNALLEEFFTTSESPMPQESELLLNRGSKLRITGKTASDSGRAIMFSAVVENADHMQSEETNDDQQAPEEADAPVAPDAAPAASPGGAPEGEGPAQEEAVATSDKLGAIPQPGDGLNEASDWASKLAQGTANIKKADINITGVSISDYLYAVAGIEEEDFMADRLRLGADSLESQGRGATLAKKMRSWADALDGKLPMSAEAPGSTPVDLDFPPAKDVLDGLTPTAATADMSQLTPDHTSAVNAWAHNNFAVQKYLREGSAPGWPNGELAERVRLLDEIMAASTTDVDMQLDRSLIGDKDSEFMSSILAVAPGETIYDEGYSGTTRGGYKSGLPYGQGTAANARVRLKINVPAGSRAIDVPSFYPTTNTFEDEVVLDRQGSFDVVSVEAGDDDATDLVITANYRERVLPDAADTDAEAEGTGAESEGPAQPGGAAGPGTGGEASGAPSPVAGNLGEVPDLSKSIHNVDSWEKIGGNLGGGSIGGTYKDAEGNSYYVKQPDSPAHAHNEVLHSMLERDLGVRAATVELGTSNGQLVIVSKWVPGNDGSDGSGAGLLSDKLDENDEAFIQEAYNGFTVDAWLANWDAVGPLQNNIVVGKDADGNDVPYRIDGGGAMLFSGFGNPKGSKFGPVVTELESMRNPDLSAGVLFSEMTDEQVNADAVRLATLSPERLREIIDATGHDQSTRDFLYDTLSARQASILEQTGAVKPEDPAMPTVEKSIAKNDVKKELINKAAPNPEAADAIAAATFGTKPSKLWVGSDGVQMSLGDMVVSDNDGKTGTVVSLSANGQYAKLWNGGYTEAGKKRYIFRFPHTLRQLNPSEGSTEPEPKSQPEVPEAAPSSSGDSAAPDLAAGVEKALVDGLGYSEEELAGRNLGELAAVAWGDLGGMDAVKDWQAGGDGKITTDANEPGGDDSAGAAIAKAMTQSLEPLSEDTILWRGLSSENSDAYKNALAMVEAGEGTFETNSFVSTSMSEGAAGSFANGGMQNEPVPGMSSILLRIDAKAGQPVFDMKSHQKAGDDAFDVSEVVLPAGANLRITSVEPYDGLDDGYLVNVEVVESSAAPDSAGVAALPDAPEAPDAPSSLVPDAEYSYTLLPLAEDFEDEDDMIGWLVAQSAKAKKNGLVSTTPENPGDSGWSFEVTGKGKDLDAWFVDGSDAWGAAESSAVYSLGESAIPTDDGDYTSPELIETLAEEIEVPASAAIPEGVPDTDGLPFLQVTANNAVPGMVNKKDQVLVTKAAVKLDNGKPGWKATLRDAEGNETTLEWKKYSGIGAWATPTSPADVPAAEAPSPLPEAPSMPDGPDVPFAGTPILTKDGTTFRQGELVFTEPDLVLQDGLSIYVPMYKKSGYLMNTSPENPVSWGYYLVDKDGNKIPGAAGLVSTSASSIVLNQAQFDSAMADNEDKIDAANASIGIIPEFGDSDEDDATEDDGDDGPGGNGGGGSGPGDAPTGGSDGGSSMPAFTDQTPVGYANPPTGSTILFQRTDHSDSKKMPLVVQHPDGKLYAYTPNGKTSLAFSNMAGYSKNPSWKFYEGTNPAGTADLVKNAAPGQGADAPANSASYVSGPAHLGAFGDLLFVGTKVQATTDGLTGTIIGFTTGKEQAKVLTPDGATKLRSNAKLKHDPAATSAGNSSGNSRIPGGVAQAPNSRPTPDPGVMYEKSEPDPTSPWYGDENKPVEPQAPAQVDMKNVLGSDWYKEVTADYQYKNGENLAGSSVEHIYLKALNGSLSSLEYLRKGKWISEPQYSTAKSKLDSRMATMQEALDAHSTAMAEHQRNVLEWSRANGISNVTLKGFDAPGILSLGKHAAVEHMNSKYKPKNLTASQRQSVHTQKGSSTWQRPLRTTLMKDSIDPEKVKDHSQSLFNLSTRLDQAILAAPPLAEDIVFTRTLTKDSFRLPGRSKADMMSATEIQNVQGTVQFDWGYPEQSAGSLAAGARPGYSIGNVWMDLMLPAGTRGIWAGSGFKYDAERGFIAERGLAYYIHKVEWRTDLPGDHGIGKWYMQAEVLPKLGDYGGFYYDLFQPGASIDTVIKTPNGLIEGGIAPIPGAPGEEPSAPGTAPGPVV